MEKAESLVIGWCDPGNTDSLFTSSLMSLLLYTNNEMLSIGRVGLTQTIGNQIARQRGDTIRTFEEMDVDWLLWVDSDIVIDPKAFQLLWENRDAEKRPIISGVYFISYEGNQTLPAPVPCIYKINEENKPYPVHPLPENELVQIDTAGLGFTLMHKSVAHKLREAYGETTFQITIGKEHISEDVSFFFKLKELGIPAYAHTGAIVTHVKRFFFDRNYYNLWWNVVAPMREAQVKDNQ